MYFFDFDWAFALAGLAWGLTLLLSLRLSDLFCGVILVGCLLGGISLYQDAVHHFGDRLASEIRASLG
ncbi:hypothetical protein M0534_02460 [Methylonatrum kenyense]|uniref:hypothetical protein n=1 Tax=Methylonatrum kenyense TaxID=455253 RepID=UPI0020BE531C|nr:hypothetical protein [Methylonatrum kenyense]MCK8515197.1 hypothetical protein [Methylonatrum kenyense]